MIIQEKLGILILATALLDCRATKSCEFKLPDGLCCFYCPDGQFISKNCSMIGGLTRGITCLKCSNCTNSRMISPCTRFSDTQCGPPVTTFAPTKINPNSAPKPPISLSIALYVTVPLILTVLVIAIVVRLRMVRSSAKRPTTEPYKFQQLA